jgi:hypothetical protein
MLNNAIEHSASEIIELNMKRDETTISFKIYDNGIGIYNNLKSKFGFDTTGEAIGHLLKESLLLRRVPTQEKDISHQSGDVFTHSQRQQENCFQ